jgi:hypothetical protein
MARGYVKPVGRPAKGDDSETVTVEAETPVLCGCGAVCARLLSLQGGQRMVSYRPPWRGVAVPGFCTACGAEIPGEARAEIDRFVEGR